MSSLEVIARQTLPVVTTGLKTNTQLINCLCVCAELEEKHINLCASQSLFSFFWHFHILMIFHPFFMISLGFSA